jgi:hypothetical protein
MAKERERALGIAPLLCIPEMMGRNGHAGKGWVTMGVILVLFLLDMEVGSKSSLIRLGRC